MTYELREATRQNELPADLRASEIRYRRLFESARDGILIIDADSRKITDVNPFMVELLGYSREEFLGKEVWQLGLFRDVEESKAAFQELQEQGYIRYDDMPLELKTGACREVEFISNVYMEGDHQVIQCNIRDNTEHKRVKAESEQSREWLLAIFEASQDGIVVEENEQIVFVNNRFLRMYGYDTPGEVIGKHTEHLQKSEDTERMAEYGRKRLRGEEAPTVYEFTGISKDGREMAIEASISTFSSSGKFYIVAAQRDITKRKRMEDELRRSEANLADAQRIAHIGSWSTDLLNNYLFWSDEVYEIFGISKAQFGANLESFINAIHPEDRQLVQAAADAAFWHGAPYNIEHRIITRTGFEKVVCELGEVTFDESGQPIRMTGTVQDITERKLSEEALRQAEAKYRGIVESLPAIVYLVQPFPPYSPIYISPNIKEFGYSIEEWFNRPDMWVSLLHEEDRERVLSATEVAMHQGLVTELEYRIVGRDGTIHWVQDSGRFISDAQGNRVNWQGVILDITKTKELEEQLRQAQKLESIGRLSGGIAHDFNNMLTAINGYSDLTLRRLGAGDPLRHNIEEIMKAGERSAALTRQLLAFSRQQILLPVVLYLNEIITETMKMLQRLIGEDIELITVLSPDAGPVEVDPGQVTQVIMNLAVNARDAMPHGGKLTIETANVFLAPDYASQHVGVLPGAYVMLAISDNGTGMSAKTQQHIFEPFFTTKEVGKGTGLGLSTVYGIVKQSGGNIGVYSEEGIGTTFKIYLPRVVGQAKESKRRDSPDDFPRGTETILLVEDEEMVRSLTRQILEECGYTVLEAQNGVEAISLCEKQDCQIDLLMTDVVMPQMGGRELAERFARVYPWMKILFTSGYTDDAVVRHGVINAETNFIQKPFTPDRLAHKVRKVLDAPHGK
jgi:PAS domain S-box-containing protein